MHLPELQHSMVSPDHLIPGRPSVANKYISGVTEGEQDTKKLFSRRTPARCSSNCPSGLAIGMVALVAIPVCFGCASGGSWCIFLDPNNDYSPICYSLTCFVAYQSALHYPAPGSFSGTLNPRFRSFPKQTFWPGKGITKFFWMTHWNGSSRAYSEVRLGWGFRSLWCSDILNQGGSEIWFAAFMW
jgi:hypothetical protein